MQRVGQKYKKEGFVPHYPIVIVPGLCSSAMKVIESPSKDWIDRRIWLDVTTIGFGKVWDQMSILRKKRKANKRASNIIDNDEVELITPQQAVTQEEEQTKRKWIAHMVLQKDGVTDPPGIKLRPIETIHGIMYLDPGAITNALSYVFGPLIETLWDIGYTDDTLDAAPYDWRIPPCYLEHRDGYFTKLKQKIDKLFAVDNTKVVLLAHSLGTRCTHYFLRFAESRYGREWITNHIHTWIPVGPLFLGAPKSVRATISGERMGLDAFLFPEEGILLSRGCGSSAWMFPYIVPDYDFESYVYRQIDGKWLPQALEESLVDSDVTSIWEGYINNYIKDPLFGTQADQLRAPPIDKMVAIYGINLKTETFYFYKASNKLTKLELDPAATMENYACHGGIAYETRETVQRKLLGKRRAGDGTVPYASLSYCSHWSNEIDVKIEELEGAEHREILKDKTFTRLVVKYTCHPPPPLELPNTFKNLTYEALELREKKHAARSVTLTRKGLQVKSTKSGTVVLFKKFGSIREIYTQPGNIFIIRSRNSFYTFSSPRCREIVQELNIRIKFIEYARPSDQETIDEHGQTELHLAVKDNDIVAVRELLSEERNVNAQDNNGWTPLHVATFNSYIDIMFLLLKHPSADVNVCTKDSTFALSYALRKYKENCEEVWDAFQTAGADINCRGNRNNTLLHEVVMRKNNRAVKWLLKEFCNVNAKNDSGETPLHVAVKRNDMISITMLLNNGADRHLRNNANETPLSLAKSLDYHLFWSLREYKAAGYCARAIFPFQSEFPSEISFGFASRITNIKITDEYGAGWWHGECNGKCGYFPSNFVKISEEIRDKNRPLLGSKEPEDGIEDSRDEYGQTPLHKAAFTGDRDAVSDLTSRDTNVNAQDRNGWTPLHSAASQKSLDVLLILLESEKVDISKRNSDGNTALHYIVRIKPGNELEQMKLVRILDKCIERVDIDVLGKSAETPLHQAAIKSNIFVVNYLLQHNADANALNENKAGSLFFAVASKNVSVVKLLLTYGADPTVKSKRGTPIDIATAANNSTILRLLEENKKTNSSLANTLQSNPPALPMRKGSVMPLPSWKSSKVSKSFVDEFEAFESEHQFSDCTRALDELLENQFGGEIAAFEKEVLNYFALKVSQGQQTHELKSSIIEASDTGEPKLESFIRTPPLKTNSRNRNISANTLSPRARKSFIGARDSSPLRDTAVPPTRKTRSQTSLS